MTGECLRFERGNKGAEDLQPVIAEAVRRGMQDQSAIDVRDDLVLVTESAQGADPLTTQIIVSFAAELSAQVVMALMEELVWPALRDAFGYMPLGRQITDIRDDANAQESPIHLDDFDRRS